MIMFNLALMTFFCMLTPINCFPDHYSKPKFGNVFLSVSHGFAAAFNQTDCWVCGVVPSSSQTYPYIAVPLTLQDYATVWNFTGSTFFTSNGEMYRKPITKKNEATELDYASRGLLCFENDGSGPYLGRSDCQYSLSYWNDSVTVVTPNNTSTFVLSPNTWNVAQPSANGTIFVCGKNAYNYLPAHWSGSCYFGYVVPALRLVTHPLQDHIRRKRNVIATPAEKWTSAFFPWYGMTVVFNKIDNIVFTFNKLASNVSAALELLNNGLTSVREITLQNRMALDLLLAEQGGTCAVVGKECCTYIPDLSSNVSAIIGSIRSKVASIKTELDNSKHSSWDLIGQIRKTVGSWVDGLVQGIIIFVVFIVILFLFFKVLKWCVIMMCRHKTYDIPGKQNVKS